MVGLDGRELVGHLVIKLDGLLNDLVAFKVWWLVCLVSWFFNSWAGFLSTTFVFVVLPNQKGRKKPKSRRLYWQPKDNWLTLMAWSWMFLPRRQINLNKKGDSITDNAPTDVGCANEQNHLEIENEVGKLNCCSMDIYRTDWSCTRTFMFERTSYDKKFLKIYSEISFV